MARVHATPDGDKPFTIEQELVRDEEEAIWEAAANDRAFAKLRGRRDKRLHDTDWWVLRGEITDAQTAYRRALRDLPANTADPANPIWPTAP
jgi:hypothetical protein